MRREERRGGMIRSRRIEINWIGVRGSGRASVNANAKRKEQEKGSRKGQEKGRARERDKGRRREYRTAELSRL